MDDIHGDREYILDVGMLNTYNAEGCSACGKKFNLGDKVVVACGQWYGGPKLIHASEAVWDKANRMFVERQCYAGRIQ